MKKTLHIDEQLLRQARVACNASTDTDTVRYIRGPEGILIGRA